MKLGDIARLVDVTPTRCWRKQRWRSKGAAEAQLRSLLRSAKVKNEERLNAYRCPWCRWYHVGRVGGLHGRHGQ